MQKTIFRRILAYIIDMLIVSFILAIFSKIPLISIDTHKYYDTSERYFETLRETAQAGETMSAEVMSEFEYDLAKASINSTVANLVLTIVYFIGFQFLNKGQTIGKKLMKVKVTNDNGEAPSLLQMIIHVGVGYSVFMTIITSTLFFAASKSTYLSLITYLQFLDMAIVFIGIIMILFRKDEKGLHNLLAKTKVVREG